MKAQKLKQKIKRISKAKYEVEEIKLKAVHQKTLDGILSDIT